MKCPQCGLETTKGQNYCGGCGAQLQNACPGCSTINPPFFKHCGQCGRNLVDVGSLLLDRAGLILVADPKAQRILGQQTGTLKGKPFSLFVKVDDLVVFYSHWNELMRSSTRQSVEIELASATAAVIHAQIEMGLMRGKAGPAPLVHLALSDVTELRRSMQDAQTLQDLVTLIFSWVDAFHPVGESGGEWTVSGVLEKIGLFAGAGYGFISRIDSQENTLVTDFIWQRPSGAKPRPPSPSMPIPLMARIFDRLSRERQWVVNDLQTLPDLERKALREWHRTDLGAILCHMIYRRQTPVAVIGLAADSPRPWSQQAVALVKLAGRLMADSLPRLRPGAALLQLHQAPQTPGGKHAPVAAEAHLETIDVADIEIVEEAPKPPAAPSSSGKAAREAPARPKPRMKFGSDHQRTGLERKPVFAGDDGKFVMTCPSCGFQDTVSARLFEVVGSAVRVQCPCGRRFRIVRELRRSYRKRVRLEGYFAQALGSGNKLSPGEVWGPMVVQDLSRRGLKFTCRNASRLRPGDRLQVRFNLDNANQTLIKKSVVVKSVQGDTAGCQFHGTDAYDAALGFYFL